jgi:2-oxo-4-hydroxy-4-carboxy-5-ureidoimidazoline decarboxylase
MKIEAINSMPLDAARAALLRCCGSPRWADEVLTRRPFASAPDLFAAAEDIWQRLHSEDWLEAFAAHPRIGDIGNLRKKFAPTADWASREQSGVAGANEDILRQLADGNRRYEERFGYIFIVCATGKSATEVLDMLTGRLRNTPEQELAVAAAEQAKITRLRLEKL